MCLSVASLNSGSNGSCYYAESENEAVLIDAGISCKEIEKRISRMGLSIQKIKAVFISHEHADHIFGLSVFIKKYSLPVYVTSVVLLKGITIPAELVRLITAHKSVRIGNIEVTAFPKLHDAADPHSFVVSCRKVTVGVFTDIGFACSNVIHYFKQCTAAFLEANYDDDMLMKSSYPYVLKRRISGTNGHLSNRQALELFTAHKPAFMTHLFLSHLSQNNNTPELVEQLFSLHAKGVEIIIASRFKETAIYTINEQFQQARKHVFKDVRSRQLSFQFN